MRLVGPCAGLPAARPRVSWPAAMTRHDAVIVGGGHNGLVAAAYLARAGRSVLVLERRDHSAARPSPSARGPASTPGCRATPTSSPCCRGRSSRDLGLGVELRRRAVSSYTPRPGRRAALLVAHRRSRRTPPGATFYAMTAARRRARVFPTLTAAAADARRSCARAVADDAAWEALFERPLGEAGRGAFADDLVRGVVADRRADRHVRLGRTTRRCARTAASSTT